MFDGTVGLPAKLFAVNGSNQLIPSGVFTPLTGWTTRLDTASAFNPATGVFTCPADGYYQVDAQLLLNTTSAGAATNLFCVIEKNGAPYTSGEFPVPLQVGAVNAANTSTGGGSLIQCAKGDQLTIVVLQNAGSSIRLFNSTLFNYVRIIQHP